VFEVAEIIVIANLLLV